MNTTRKFLLAGIILLLGSSLFGLELKQGRMKVVLHENTGRFSAYYLTDVRRNRYTPFLLDDDPRTSVMSLLVGNKVYRMGESFDFSQSVQKTADGAAFIWKSGFLEIHQEFTFISSAESSLSDGFIITVTIRNIAESPVSVGMRYLFDTYIGEDDEVHFSTPSRASVREELDYTGSLPDYWVSTGSRTEPIALQVMLRGPGITKPDRLILANWKRLNDSSWNYDSSGSRNFNLLPYSINDSAACIYYNPVQIPSGGERVITMVLGQYSAAGFALTERTDEEISELYTKTVSSDTSAADPMEIARTDLLTIKDLLDRIDGLIVSGSKVPQDQIDAIAQIVQNLEERKKQHEEQR